MNLVGRTDAVRFAIWLTLLVIPIVGCSSGEIAKVSGRVTMDGEPLVNASVTFQPIAKADDNGQAGTSSYGRTDSDGRFSLITIFGDTPGAVIGTHKVRISTEGSGDASGRSDDNRRGGREAVPLRYRDGSLIFEVPASGSDEANFDLTSGPAP